MSTRLSAAIAFAVVAFAAFPVTAESTTLEQSRDGQLGIRLLEGPVGREADPRAGKYVVDHMPPGTEFTRSFELVNTTGRDLTVDVYPAAAEISDQGWRTVPGRAKNELARWIVPESPTVTVPAGGRLAQSFTVDVPNEATAGERYAVLWAEPPAGRGAIGTTNRVGIRFYLSVGPGGEPLTDFTIDSLTAARDGSGRPVVRARVENVGGRAIDLAGQLSLREGPAGLSAGPYSADSGVTLAPGDEGSMSVVLDAGLPTGPWLARMEATSGETAKAVEGRVVFPEAAGQSAAPVEATEVPLHQDRGFLLPLALGLLMLALFLVFLVWWLKRRQKDEDEVDQQAQSATSTTDQ